MREASRVFAIVPAAGLSRRMGEPKLSLPYGNSTVLGHVIHELSVAAVKSVRVVVRREDTATAKVASAAGAEVVFAENDPPDMRESVEIGLRHLMKTTSLHRNDAWLLCPGDCVGLESSITQQLADGWSRGKFSNAEVVVPSYRGRRGHPGLFSASVIEKLFALESGVGVNALLKRSDVSVAEIVVDSFGVMEDVDTPEQYNAAVQRRTESGTEE